MLHLEIVGSSPRVNLPLKIGYVDKPPASAPAATFSTRVVRVPLNRRGLTRTPHPDDPPILDSVDEGPFLPPHRFDHVQNQVSSVYSTPVSSGRSSPTAETHSTLTPSQGGWNDAETGNDTERSSLDSSYSWDEFDRQAAKTVNRHFDEIEAFLFGEGSSEKTSSMIMKECQDWSTHFPHLRVLGTQKIEPQETGYREFPRDSPRLPTSGLLQDVTDNDITSDSQGLLLTGRGMKPMKAPVDVTSPHHDPSNEYAYLIEEVFEQDGVYEEVIAIDSKDNHEDTEHKKQIIPRRRRIGYPPITPNACVKDSVASSVFDCMWNEIIAWMRPLLKEYSSILTDSKQELVPTSTYPMTSVMHDVGPSTRESSYLGMVHKNLPPYGGITRAHTITAPSDTNRSIQEILQIKTITLNTKNKTGQDSVDASTTFNSKRPVSKTQNRLRRKLEPLPNRSQTPMAEDMPANVLHVKSITFQKNVSGSYQRHTAVPPLAYDIQQEKTKRKNSSVRASSAIDNKDVRNWHHFNRERQTIDPRPSTTHAMRSDTPLGSTGRRSSTPLSYNRGLGVFPGGKTLGITGNSLQHPNELAHPNIMEDVAMEDSPLHNQWPMSVPKSRTRTTLRAT